MSHATQSENDTGQTAGSYLSRSTESRDDEHLHPLSDVLCYVKEYARQRPEVVALTCLGIGFLLGWKLKPW
jgi:hypothetical protein